MKSRLTMIFTTVMAISLICSAVLYAGDITAKNTVYGLKAGLITGGEFWIGGADPGTSASFSFGGFMDYKLGEKITGGLALEFHNMTNEDDGNILIDIGITLKAQIAKPSSKFIFRPGIGLAYGILGELGPAEGSNYFVLKGGSDMIIKSSNNFNWLVDVQIIGAPTGGNDDYEMTFGPMFLLRGGVVF